MHLLWYFFLRSLLLLKKSTRESVCICSCFTRNNNKNNFCCGNFALFHWFTLGVTASLYMSFRGIDGSEANSRVFSSSFFVFLRCSESPYTEKFLTAIEGKIREFDSDLLFSFAFKSHLFQLKSLLLCVYSLFFYFRLLNDSSSLSISSLSLHVSQAEIDLHTTKRAKFQFGTIQQYEIQV